MNYRRRKNGTDLNWKANHSDKLGLNRKSDKQRKKEKDSKRADKI